MNSFLRNLTTSQQIGALFIVVFGVLSLATLWGFFRSLREHASDDPQAEAHAQEVKRFWGLIKTSWVMATVFWIGWALGDTVATVLFAIVGFFALREFITLSPTRRGDHRSLVLAFFVVLPLQFTIVGSRMFDLFTVFIPVYVFLALPVVSALANDPERFLERNAKLQWGIMVCVYGMSHVPALLLLDFPGYREKGAFLVFFLVFVVQTCMLVQHLVGRRFPHKPVAPAGEPELSVGELAGRRGRRGPGGRAAVVHHPVQAGAGAGHGAAGLLCGQPGASGDEGPQARPGRDQLGHAGHVGHRRGRPARPRGRAVLRRPRVLPLHPLVLRSLSKIGH